jgi:hypothetical protein
MSTTTMRPIFWPLVARSRVDRALATAVTKDPRQAITEAALGDVENWWCSTLRNDAGRESVRRSCLLLRNPLRHHRNRRADQRHRHLQHGALGDNSGVIRSLTPCCL